MLPEALYSKNQAALGRCPSRHRRQSAAMPVSSAGDMAAAAEGAEGKQPSSYDLLIVGPGVLGSYVGKLWLDDHPDVTVVGQTNTTSNHDRLRSLGLQPRVKGDADDRKFPFVMFAAPPSGTEDYPAEIAKAATYWDGTGTFLFSGSAGIFAVDDGSQCNEDSPVAPLGRSDRNDRLLLGEQAVMDSGGCVVRLVGLYHSSRGAHNFFLKAGEVDRWGGYTVNLIHYEDAASISVAILRGDGNDEGFYRKRVFIGTDGAPVTFTDMMAAVESSNIFEGHTTFTAEEGTSKGKLVSNSTTLRTLGWRPKYSSFERFIEMGARDWYSETAKQ